MARLRCLVRGHHNPERHPLGGFRCLDCGEAGADYDEMGFHGTGYVNPLRKIFSRDNGGTLTRTRHYEPSRRGD